MGNYKPNAPFNVPVMLLKPTVEYIKGVQKKTYPHKGDLIFCSVRTFGGTEKVVNDVLVVENTATVETRYRPDIKADCRLMINGVVYEILGEPENIDMRGFYMVIKVRAVKGGA